VKIEFNNLEELDDFIAWVRSARDMSQDAPNAAWNEVPVHDTSAAACAAAQTAPIAVSALAEFPTGMPADKPKRTRRTKAEMEAARAAELAAQTGATELVQTEPQAAPSGLANEPEPATGNPFSNGTQMIEAALAAPDAASATRAVGEALRAESTRPNTAGAPDAAAWIAAKEQELIKVDAIECLRLSRNFIAKHGFQNYQRVFALTGLPAEITKYKEAERLQHAATMAFLAEHPDA
jgi:hypothetical protein